MMNYDGNTIEASDNVCFSLNVVNKFPLTSSLHVVFDLAFWLDYWQIVDETQPYTCNVGGVGTLQFTNRRKI